LFPRKKTTFTGNNVFPKERPKFLGETYVPNHFVIITISYSFLYGFVIYHGKVLKDNYNFVIGIISIRIH
jgi:hypothetical protein